MGVVATVGKGVIAAGEGHIIFKSRTYVPDSSVVPAIYCHHATGGCFTPYKPAAIGTPTDLSMANIVEVLALAGHPVIANDQAGPNSWSNDTALTNLSGALTRVAADTGCNANKVLLLADSMGTLLALNWAKANASKVVAMALLLPIPNLQDIHDNGPVPIPANIETAFGGAVPYGTARDAHNPSLTPASFTNIPTKFWYSSDDPTASPAQAQSFATAIGAPIVSMGAVGHTVPSTVAPVDVANFLLTHV